jgi:hypothetical protein
LATETTPMIVSPSLIGAATYITEESGSSMLAAGARAVLPRRVR